MSPDLEDRLGDLHVVAPDDLKSEALRRAAEAEPQNVGRAPWLQVVGAAVVVLVVVVIVLNVSAAPAHNIFSNISAGLGT
jgi:hypothetical protein